VTGEQMLHKECEDVEMWKLAVGQSLVSHKGTKKNRGTKNRK